MLDVRDIQASLVQQAHPDGGWGYAPGQAAHLEPTCLALLALAKAEDGAEARQRGLDFLLKAAAADGTFHLPADREEAIWPTALALLVQCTNSRPAEEIQRSVERLLAARGRKPDEHQAAEVHDIDLNLVGWPWAQGNFSWVEPTAWACLALRHAGWEDHPYVREGLKLLLDRAHDDGGINYGNRHVLGRRTDPIPGPTALMLLALQGHGDEPRVATAAAYLLKEALDSADLENLCWAKIALTCHGDQPYIGEALATLDKNIEAAYESRQQTPWLRASPPRLALAALALQTDRFHPLRLGPVRARLGEGNRTIPAQRSMPSGRTGLGARLKAAMRGLAVDAVCRLRPLPPQTPVHIARAESYDTDLADVLQRQFADFRERVPLKGKRVVLKPNLVEYSRDKVINTHPHVVAAAIELCQREGAAEVIVAEGPGHWRNVEYLVQASGLGDVLRHYRVPFVDLNHDEPVKTPNLGRLTGLEFLYLARTVASADVLISLPKLKTHHWAGATLSLKNLFGTLPGICYGWPKNELHWRGIDNSIIDIALTRTPDLAIVDGIVGMEGDGPLNGTARAMGALIMGCDPLAVDATCCRLMGLEPERIKYLWLGQQKRVGLLGGSQISQLGEKIEGLAQSFETVPHFQGIRRAMSA